MDVNGYNLLHQASSQGNLSTVKYLLELRTDKELDDKKAQNLAWFGKHSDVLITFAKANLQYPDEIDIEQLSDEFRHFYKKTEDLHNAIKAKNEENVKSILNENNNLRHYLNLSNQSASCVAIIEDLPEIYKILQVYGVVIADHECGNQGIFKTLSPNMLRKYRKIHNEIAKGAQFVHIEVLKAHSFITHTVSDSKEKFKFVERAYNRLNDIPTLKTILQVVANSRNFKIIFDFNRESADVANPMVWEETEGICYFIGEIYIGAKHLADENSNKFGYALGVLIHEISHYANVLVFENKAKPYKSGNLKRESKFEQITKECMACPYDEEIIKSIFKYYDKKSYHLELIVRPPQLLAMYHKQPEKLQEVKENYSKLFENYEKFVIPAMEKSNANKGSKKYLKVSRKSIQSLFSLFAIILIILGTFTFYYFTTGLSQNVKFDDLKPFQKDKVLKGPILFKNESLVLCDIFNENSTALRTLTSKLILDLYNGKTLNFSSLHLRYLSQQYYPSWGNLTLKLREKVLNSNILFQNEKVKILDLLNDHEGIRNNSCCWNQTNQDENLPNNTYMHETHAQLSNLHLKIHKTPLCNSPLNSLTSSDIEYILDEKILQIGIKVNREVDFFIQRKLLNAFSGKTLQINDLAQTDDNFIIIKSGAGEGKTVIFQELALIIKKLYPLKWVSYIHLKNFTEVFENSDTDYFKILHTIVGTKTKFEASLFEKLFCTGNVVLFWNGYDEIPPNYGNTALKFMNFIQSNFTNIQFLSLRSIEALQVGGIVYDVQPLSQEDVKDYIRKFLQSKNKTIDEKWIKNVQQQTYELKLQSPLILRMIVENANNYEKLHNLSIHSIFELYIQNSISKWKISFPNIHSYFNLDTNFNIWNFLKKYALLNELSRFTDIKKLKIFNTNIPNQLTYEDISKLGIIKIKSEYEFEFIQKSFAEYLVAQYFIKSLFDTTNFDPLAIEVLYNLNNDIVISRIILEYLNEQQAKNSTINPDFIKLVKLRYKNIFFDFLKSQNFKIIEILFKIFERDSNLLAELLHVDKPETLYTAAFSHNLNNEFTDFSKILKIYRLAVKSLNPKNFVKFLEGKNQKGKILFGITFMKIFSFNEASFATAQNFSTGYNNLLATPLKESNPIIYPELKYFLDFMKSANITSPQYFLTYDNLYKVLNIHEIQELFIFIAGNLSKFSSLFPQISNIQNFWRIHNYLNLTVAQNQHLFAAAIKDCFLIISSSSKNDILSFILGKSKNYLTNAEILEMFENQKILLETIGLDDKMWGKCLTFWTKSYLQHKNKTFIKTF